LLVAERVDIKELGGVAVDCFVLKSEGGWYAIYMRVLGKPPSGTPEASEGEVKTWEGSFKYHPEHRTYEVISFLEVDNFLVPEDVKQEAMMISEKDEEIRAFLTENFENNLTSKADWISRHDGVVRLQFIAVSALNKTHALCKGLTSYIDLKGEEVLYVQRYEGVFKFKEKREEAGTLAVTNVAVSAPLEYCGLGALLVAVAGALLAIRKLKKPTNPSS
ncbi:MAG: hypothetical protein DRJ69_01195, partial [Thermoprotei archaeon]